MKCLSHHFLLLLGTLVLLLTGCASRSPDIILPTTPPPPIPSEKWREVEEEIAIASNLARLEAERYALEEMEQWITRVREQTDTEFVPWYTGYWTQQWIGLKAAWYEMSDDEDDPPVQDYLVDYIQQQYNELVLEPAGTPSDPRMISERTATLYIQLLSEQLQSLPQMYTVAPLSLKLALQQIPLIVLSSEKTHQVSLSLLLERDNLVGLAAYESLVTHTGATSIHNNSSPHKDPLQVVAEDTVARLVADLPVRAGGSAAALLLGESLGLFISAGVTAWSINAHEQKKPEIESQLRQALNTGLDEMWERLMNDPRLGVMFPVNHMHRQIERHLFPHHEPDVVLPF